MTLFWLSFAADDGFRGVAIVEGSDMIDAVRRAHLLGINPGGQVLGPDIPPEFPWYDVALANRDRLIGKEELCRLFPDGMNLGEHEDRTQTTLTPPAGHVLKQEEN